MNERPRRRRRETLYDPQWGSSVDAHALQVSALMRDLQRHLERVRRGEASAEELREMERMVRAARRADRAH